MQQSITAREILQRALPPQDDRVYALRDANALIAAAQPPNTRRYKKYRRCFSLIGCSIRSSTSNMSSHTLRFSVGVWFRNRYDG